MKNDRFLVGILVFIGLLIVAAVTLFIARGSSVDYLPEDSPEAVVHNYALAVTRGEYERAYALLVEGAEKPSQADFISYFSQFNPLQDASLRIGEARMLAEEAVVEVSVVYSGGGPFDTGYTQDGSAILVLANGDWKIKEMPYPYWDFGWYGQK